MRNKDDSSGDLFAQAGENIPDDAGNKAGSADDGQTPQPARSLSSPSLVEQFAAEHQKQALSLESQVNQESAEAHGSPDASGSGGLMDGVDVTDVADGGSQPPVEDGNGASGGGNDEDGVPLHVFAERAYLTYAMSTVLDRALPFIEDGQKPVQRRILYAMRELGSRHDVPFKKSARIVGDVIGKFHPHGDSAVYEAAVRMAQDFTLRYPLIEGQGNFGSRDGDQAAAMRYTEIRLSRFAEDILLGELDRGTVDYRENYDGTLKEPALLPARLPVLLLNGVSGIAVGMATEMQPHNLREVATACIAVLQAGQGGQNSETDAATATVIIEEAIYAAIPGPDFPGGAQLISSREDIRKAYETGRGSLRLRARWEVEPLARGQYRVAITELPPNTNTARVLAEIEELTNPKVKSGKKSLTSDQQNLKNAALAVLDAFRDDSDRAHPVRIVLEPRSRTVSSDDLVNFLLANTSLESNVAVNMTMIGRDGRPQQKSLPRIVHEWCEYRLTVIERRLRHRHTEVERRLHILDGRMIAFLHIDEVIRIIRESDDAKLEMKIRFGLTDTQVEDILEIRLRQLARLEGIRIEKEIAELKAERDGLNHLLGSENARRQLAIEEIEKDAARYGDARRTRIETAEKVTAARVEVTSDDPVTILLSKNGFIRCRSGHGIDRSLLNWKDGDGERAIVETRTVHPIILFDASGRAYTLKAADLPGGKGDGVPLTSLLDLGGSIIGMVSAPAEARVLMASSAGVGFIGTIADMTARNRAGKAYMSIDEGARLLPPVLMPDNVQYMAALAEASLPRLLVFPIDEMKALSGGKGVILIGLDAARHEQLLAACAFGRRVAVTGIGRGDKESEILVGPGEKENDLAHYLGKRARKGKALPPRLKRISGLKAVVEAVQANKMDAAASSEKPSGLPQPAIGTGVGSAPEAGNTLLDLPGVDDDTGNMPPENGS